MITLCSMIRRFLSMVVLMKIGLVAMVVGMLEIKIIAV